MPKTAFAPLGQANEPLQISHNVSQASRVSSVSPFSSCFHLIFQGPHVMFQLDNLDI